MIQAFRRSPYDREIVRIGLPALGALAADPLVSLVDTAFIGRLGAVALAAVAIASAIYAAVFAVFNFLEYAVTPLVAQSIGAGDRDEAERFTVAALTISVMGGVIAGKRVVVDYLRQKARPFLFSSATTPADTAACLAAVDLLEESSELVEKLWANTKYFKDGMAELGFDTGRTETPIIPIIIGDDDLTFLTWKLLFDAGVFVNPIISPATPAGCQLLRTSYMATHTDEQLDEIVDVMTRVGREANLIP